MTAPSCAALAARRGRGRAGHQPRSLTGRCRPPTATRSRELLLPALAAAGSRPRGRRGLRSSPSTCPTCAACAPTAAARRRRPLPVADASRRSTPAAARRAPAGAHRPLPAAGRLARALRAPAARLLCAHGRARRPLRARRRPAREAAGVDADARPRDPARRLRLPDPPAGRAPLPAELAAVEGPVILLFGLLRPYKGVDVLLEAFREIEGAELWIVGMPRMDLAAAATSWPRAARGPCASCPASSPTPRSPALLSPRRRRRAPVPRDRAVGRPLHGARLRQADRAERRRRLPRGRRARRRRPPGPRRATRRRSRRRSRELLARPGERERAGGRGRAAAAGPYSWDAIAARTLDLYRELVRG